MSRLKPTIVGEVLFDCFPDGRCVLGGAPFNVAWHLRGFGADPLFLSAIGDDAPGREILARMREHGMRTNGLQVREELETGRVDVQDASGVPSYTFPERSAWDAFELEGAPTPEGPTILYQGTLFLRQEASRNASLALAERLGCPRFVDINLRAPWYEPRQVAGLLRGARCVKASAEELGLAATWLGIRATSSLDDLVRAFIETADVEQAFVTMGSAGALWTRREGPVKHFPAGRAEPFVDSVGAGDASAAVALWGLLAGWTDDVLMRRAMDFAGRICTLSGAIPPNGEFYNDVSRNWD